jgi:hypothetical protein
MERFEAARAVRRRRAVEAIEEERGRERLLVDQLAEIVAEADGPELDRATFASMEPADVAIVRELLGDHDPDADRDRDAFDLDFELEDEPSLEDEISRLGSEIELCRRRIRALEQYLAAIDAPPVDRAQSV